MDISAFAPRSYSGSLSETGRMYPSRDVSAQGEIVGDSASMSHDGILMTVALATANNAPDVRAAKVDSLRAQIEDGSYVADSQLIAECLIRDEAELYAL